MIANYNIVIPEVSGIYLATILSSVPMPVTRDQRYVDTCGRVTKHNMKIGKAVNLANRRKNYWKDFDMENVIFLPLAELEDIKRAESEIKKALGKYRMRSPKGYLMEWLKDISQAEVTGIVFEVLDKGGFSYRIIKS